MNKHYLESDFVVNFLAYLTLKIKKPNGDSKMETKELKDSAQKEADQLKKQYQEAAKDVVPFYQKYKKVIIISGVVLLVIIGIFIVI